MAIVATALSVATMVLSLAFISGFKQEIRSKLFSFWGHVHVIPYSPNASNLISPEPIIADWQLQQNIEKIPHVTDVTPFAIRPAIVNANHYMEGIQLKGISSKYKLPASIRLKGSWMDFSDTAYAKSIVLSQTTGSRLNVKPGDDLVLYFLQPGASFPRVRKLKVAGLFHTGMEEVDKDFAICDIRLLQRINGWQPSNINGYQVTLDDPLLSDTISMQIFQQYLEPPLTTNTMSQIFPNVFDWLQLLDMNARTLLIIMSLVAIINLAVALLILIVEQAKMVGLLKAQGMRLWPMMQIFVYHSVLIATIGVLLGNAIALGICWLQQTTGFLTLPEANYYMETVKVSLEWWHVVLIDVVTLVLCILCMCLPALYIRRIHPARVLQFK
jgi:lipoprotein-releasing system permease protein